MGRARSQGVLDEVDEMPLVVHFLKFYSYLFNYLLLLFAFFKIFDSIYIILRPTQFFL